MNNDDELPRIQACKNTAFPASFYGEDYFNPKRRFNVPNKSKRCLKRPILWRSYKLRQAYNPAY